MHVRRAPETVLIIDDDPCFVDDLLALWQPLAEVHRVASSREALDFLASNTPSLILLDLSLPHDLASLDSEEGCRLLARMRRDLDCRAVVIVVTGQPETELHRRTLALGAAAVVTKPVDIDHLARVIREAGIDLAGVRID